MAPEEWWIWRVVTHERNRSSLHEIETLWSTEDVRKAHLVFDMFDELARRQADG